MAEMTGSQARGTTTAGCCLSTASLRVLELSATLAGAVTGMLLADFGADVTLAESRGGHALRGEVGFRVWSRGKHRVTADARIAPGRHRLRELVAAADVLVDDLAPGELQRRGLDPTS